MPASDALGEPIDPNILYHLLPADLFSQYIVKYNKSFNQNIGLIVADFTFNPYHRAFNRERKGFNPPRKAFDVTRRGFDAPLKGFNGYHRAIDGGILDFNINHSLSFCQFRTTTTHDR